MRARGQGSPLPARPGPGPAPRPLAGAAALAADADPASRCAPHAAYRPAAPDSTLDSEAFAEAAVARIETVEPFRARPTAYGNGGGGRDQEPKEPLEPLQEPLEPLQEPPQEPLEPSPSQRPARPPHRPATEPLPPQRPGRDGSTPNPSLTPSPAGRCHTPAERTAPAKATAPLPLPLVFIETAGVRLQSRLACTSKVLRLVVQDYWRQTPRVAGIKAYTEGIRCPVSRQGVLDDLLSVDPRRTVAPRPGWHDGEPLDLRTGWPVCKVVYALANGVRYQLTADTRDKFSLVSTAWLSEPYAVQMRASRAFRDCLRNGLGRHLKKLEIVMMPTMDPLVDDFTEGVQGGGLPSLHYLILRCTDARGRMPDMLRAVCTGIPTLRRLELHQCGGIYAFETSMRFPALRRLTVSECGDDLATAFARAARDGGFPRLTTLELEYYDIGDAGCAAVAGALRHTRVRMLSLRGNWNITDAGASELLKDVESLRRLKTLVLDSPSVTIWSALHEVMVSAG